MVEKIMNYDLDVIAKKEVENNKILLIKKELINEITNII
jgi:hypothetical protein